MRSALLAYTLVAAALLAGQAGAENGRPPTATPPTDAPFDLSIEGGGGYRASPDSAALSSPFLLAHVRPELTRQANALWKADAHGDISVAPHLSTGVDWSGEAGIGMERKGAAPLFFSGALTGGYYRISEPLAGDPWEYALIRALGECGLKKRNSASVQYLFDGINGLPYWTGRHTLRLRAGLRPRPWFSSTVKAGCSLARSETIATAASWDSVDTYAEIAASAAGTVLAGPKNAFSALVQGQRRWYDHTLTGPGRGASPRKDTVTSERATAVAASVIYCREVTQHIDLYVDCSYWVNLWGNREDVRNALRLSASVEWHLQNL